LKFRLPHKPMTRCSRFLAGAALFLLTSWLAMANQSQALPREEIDVVNVEVPVRVFLDGLPLADLQKDDFRLFEDNEPQAINGF